MGKMVSMVRQGLGGAQAGKGKLGKGERLASVVNGENLDLKASVVNGENLEFKAPWSSGSWGCYLHEVGKDNVPQH